MTIKRREFLEMALAGAVIGAATPALANGKFGHPTYERWTPRPTDLEPGKVFRHGVASGDPLKDRVVLWTRITPKHDAINSRRVRGRDRPQHAPRGRPLQGNHQLGARFHRQVRRLRPETG